MFVPPLHPESYPQPPPDLSLSGPNPCSGGIIQQAGTCQPRTKVLVQGMSPPSQAKPTKTRLPPGFAHRRRSPVTGV